MTTFPETRSGGPAFPIDAYLSSGTMEATGLTKLEFFAAHAMAGNLAAMNPGTIDKSMSSGVARGAVWAAEAMMVALAEREKRIKHGEASDRAGFTSQDYSSLAEQISENLQNGPVFKALLSNNFNVILAALAIAARVSTGDQS